MATDSYTLTIGSYPHTWRLWLPVEDSTGKLRDWWQSAETFKLEEEAYKALENYYSPFEATSQEKNWIYIGSEDETDIAHEQESVFLKHRYAYAAQQPPAAALCDDWIAPTKNAQSGRFSYRLVKRDEPLAFHPDNSFPAGDNQDLGRLGCSVEQHSATGSEVY